MGRGGGKHWSGTSKKKKTGGGGGGGGGATPGDGSKKGGATPGGGSKKGGTATAVGRATPTYFDPANPDTVLAEGSPGKKKQRRGPKGHDLEELSPTSRAKVLANRERRMKAYRKKQAEKQNPVPLPLEDSPTKPFREKSSVKDAPQARRKAVHKVVAKLPNNPA